MGLPRGLLAHSLLTFSLSSISLPITLYPSRLFPSSPSLSLIIISLSPSQTLSLSFQSLYFGPLFFSLLTAKVGISSTMAPPSTHTGRQHQRLSKLQGATPRWPSCIGGLIGYACSSVPTFWRHNAVLRPPYRSILLPKCLAHFPLQDGVLILIRKYLDHWHIFPCK